MNVGHSVDAGLFWPGFVAGMILGACLSHLDATEDPKPKARTVTSEELADAIEDMERQSAM